MSDAQLKQAMARYRIRRFDDWRSLASNQKPIRHFLFCRGRYSNVSQLRVLRRYGFRFQKSKHSGCFELIRPVLLSSDRLKQFWNFGERTPKLKLDLGQLLLNIRRQEKLPIRKARF